MIPVHPSGREGEGGREGETVGVIELQHTTLSMLCGQAEIILFLPLFFFS